jgi:hypothetical protein
MSCPFCGGENFSTTGICPKHIAFEYDSGGHLIARTDMVKINDWQSVSMRIPCIPEHVAKMPSPRAVR